MVCLVWTATLHPYVSILVFVQMSLTLFHIGEIKALCEQYDAMLMVDECHATGILGKLGRGTDELLGIHGQIDIINSTLGKALGGAMGGYTAGPKEIIDLLRQKSRPYTFSNALAPSGK